MYYRKGYEQWEKGIYEPIFVSKLRTIQAMPLGNQILLFRVKDGTYPLVILVLEEPCGGHRGG